MDMNARELRNIVTGLGKDRMRGGVVHESGFIITSASEIAAILGLALDYDDLRARLERIVVAYTYDKEPVTVKDLGCVGALMVLLKDAINPNLVQTLEGQPVFVHGFPFANIAHGTNSILATKTALKLGDYVVTEAGFASDLGGEKFMDIVCRESGLRPSCVVIVASVRALMTHGGGILEDESTLTLETLKKGMCNLDKHIDIMSSYGVPVVVGINHFAHDTQEQMDFVRDHCKEKGVEVAFNDGFIKGGEGSVELAQTVIHTLETKKSDFKFLYDLDTPIKEKIETIAKNVYGADGVTYDLIVEKRIAKYEEDGFGNLPICIAKTQASLSDVPELKGVPKGWKLHVREINISAGAGFIVPECGTLTLMPGLPGVPSAMRMDFLPTGKIVGLK
jgi:formate--tetrahydrofolate ligase